MAIRIGFVGLSQAGKTTAAEYVAKQTGALMFSWAGPLKLEVYNWLALCRRNPMAWIHKEQPDPLLFSAPPINVWRGIPELDNQDKISWINRNKHELRSVLQWWGTEYRRGQDENYWAEQGCKFIDGLHSEINIVSDDARFNNEGDVMKSHGFKICQIDRPGTVQLTHASEQLEIEPHYHLLNDGTIEDLYKSLDTVIEAYNG